MNQQRKSTTTFDYVAIVRETGAAYLIDVIIPHDKDDDERREIWFPKSQVEIFPKSRIVSVPNWLVDQNNMRG